MTDHHDERSPLLLGDNNEPNQGIDDQEVQRPVRSSHDTNSPQYEGLPEVKKKLRWIVPAVAIGASFFFFFLPLHHHHSNHFSQPECLNYRYSSQLQI